MTSPRNTTAEAKEFPELMLAETMLRGGSGAIEAQEAQGQRELVNSSVLPTDGLHRHPVFAHWGIVIGAVVPNDPMFTNVTLPAGWAKKETDHSMWSDLVDEKGRKRAGIFYKAAFYDRSAHIRPCNRFSATPDVDHEKNTVVGTVLDAGQVVWRSAETREYGSGKYANYDAACGEAVAWLNEHYPDWKNVGAYWDA